MSEEQKGDADGDKGMHLTQSTLLSHICIRQTIAPPNIRVSCHIYSQIDRKLVFVYKQAPWVLIFALIILSSFWFLLWNNRLTIFDLETFLN